ncbi:MAG: hypothetical protein JO317_03175, partial [Verrucomicrobiae bacterium]|nr:hypothetical protein [Verrucomicrobiae bacterium]
DAQEQSGLAQLGKRSPEAAFEDLRPLIRQDPAGPRAQRIADALRKAIQEADRKKDFETLLNVTGFYVAEVGTPGSSDPFRETLRSILPKTAESMKASEPMKRIFLLSLIADVFAGEPEGERARQSAMDVGSKVMAGAKEEQAKSDQVLPSNLGGLSVLSIDNATPYHMLVFYDGPEKFFVRFNPFRRGSVVLRDGKYTTGVIVTDASIEPYRSQSSHASEHQVSSYIIQSSNSPNRPAFGMPSQASGDYKLLRAPPDVEGLRVDPKTGAVSLGSAATP